jgi:hypothetical protein
VVDLKVIGCLCNLPIKRIFIRKMFSVDNIFGENDFLLFLRLFFFKISFIDRTGMYQVYREYTPTSQLICKITMV